MLSQEAIEKILGIREKTTLTPEEMAGKLSLTFYPLKDSSKISEQVLIFSKELERTLKESGVNIVPFDQSLESVSIKKRADRLFASLINNALYLIGKKIVQKDRTFIDYQTLRGILKKKRIKPGISVIVLGENELGNMPIDMASSFRLSSVITILDKPPHISEKSNFYDHFNTAMEMFAYHMTNIVILVDGNKWLLYNFNASHPIYDRSKNFKQDIMNGLLPKIVAPIRPYRFKDFEILKTKFNPNDKEHSYAIDDLIKSGPLFEKSGLYPPGKKIEDLPFRTKFYEWIGKIHLDHRTGMSYGFLAWQLPVNLPPLIPLTKELEKFSLNHKLDDFFEFEKDLYLIIELPDGRYSLKIPEIWILSQRSGSNKTKMDRNKDIVKIGLKNGKMFMQIPNGATLPKDYRPSFDTGVMLAHGVGNAIIASIMYHLKLKNKFLEKITESGLSLSHWHGYIDPQKIPAGWHVHGIDRPHVSCSSPQSAIYALDGKLTVFEKTLKNGKEYLGDIHIEPQHGTNITYYSQRELVELFLYNKGMATLGSDNLNLYD